MFHSDWLRPAASHSDSHEPRYKHEEAIASIFYRHITSYMANTLGNISGPVSLRSEREEEITIDTLTIAARRRHFRFVYVFMRSPIDNASTVSSCRELRKLINFVTRVSSIVLLCFCIRCNEEIQSPIQVSLSS